ncbi:hypothetical protein [Microbacterium maritypicum]
MHYDSYGTREVFVDTIEGQWYRTFVDVTIRSGDNRFLIWVQLSDRDAVGQRRTYKTRSAAVKRAQQIRRQGYGVRVVDRMIRRGDTGFLADRSGSYYRADDGTLHTGSFSEIQQMLTDIGYWDKGRHRVSLAAVVAPGESIAINV